MSERSRNNRYAQPERWAAMLRDLRTDSGLTQQQVADRISVSQRTYADYELGRLRMPIEHVAALADFYEVSMDRLCGTGAR